MTKTLYREISNKYGSSRSSYNACSITGCRGECVGRTEHCISHLNERETEVYTTSLRSGQGSLNFSGLEVDSGFVHEWVEKVAETTDRETKSVPVPIAMQETTMADSLAFNNIEFPHGLNLSSFKGESVRIGDSQRVRSLVLNSAVLRDEISLQGIHGAAISLVGCRAKIFWLLRSSVSALDARSLSVEKGIHVRQTTVNGPADFSDGELGDEDRNATISAIFKSRADFSSCRFPRDTRFGRYSDLAPSRFEAGAMFDASTFGSAKFGVLVMDECVFRGTASFKQTSIYGAVSFNGAEFNKAADLNAVTIKAAPFVMEGDDAEGPTAAFEMAGTQFASSVALAVDAQGDIAISDVSFNTLPDGISLRSTALVRLLRTRFDEFGDLSVQSSQNLTLDHMQFHSGGEIKVEAPFMALTNFTCASPVSISAGTGDHQEARTRLTSLAGTNCEGLTLSGFDFSMTRFLSAPNLDKMIVSGEFDLPLTKGWRSRRRFLIEEARARETVSRRRYWSDLLADSTIPSGTGAPTPRELVATYRALRKGREDQKDEPGGADFYYGEMEMRRLSSSPRSVNRVILTLYWLVSGYGLRAWRALATLATIVIGGAIALTSTRIRVTDTHDASLRDALLFSAQSGVSLAGSPSSYTDSAQLVQLLLRILVPLLIALTVLAIRARVRR